MKAIVGEAIDAGAHRVRHVEVADALRRRRQAGAEPAGRARRDHPHRRRRWRRRAAASSGHAGRRVLHRRARRSCAKAIGRPVTWTALLTGAFGLGPGIALQIAREAGRVGRRGVAADRLPPAGDAGQPGRPVPVRDDAGVQGDPRRPPRRTGPTLYADPAWRERARPAARRSGGASSGRRRRVAGDRASTRRCRGGPTPRRDRRAAGSRPDGPA